MSNLIQDRQSQSFAISQPPNAQQKTFKDKIKNTAINIVLGQIIAVTITSGGVFTNNLKDTFKIDLPILLLSFLYFPLIGYLYFYFKKDEQTADEQPKISVKWFFLCSVIDVHATMLIVYAYYYTSITSVMLLEDFSIPSAVIMSVLFLKLRYSKIHFVAIFICACGMSFSICNDLFIKTQGESNDQKNSQIIGDIMTLAGAFSYALVNILQEHILKSTRDIYHYLGWLGLFGLLISFAESLISRQFFDLVQLIRDIDDFHNPESDQWKFRNPTVYLFLNLFGMSATNFICYTVIPFFVKRSGATLLNISNVTTVLWGMIFDITLFDQPFYVMYLIAFFLEIVGIIIFSHEQPQKYSEYNMQMHEPVDLESPTVEIEQQNMGIMEKNDQSSERHLQKSFK